MKTINIIEASSAPANASPANVQFGKSLRIGMRRWALDWRNEMKGYGKSSFSELCIRRAKDWRDSALDIEAKAMKAWGTLKA